jgi:Zn-dependent protease
MAMITNAPLFGWAKPVMVNHYNLRNPRRANIFISAAGPVSNILAAFAAIMLYLILKNFGAFTGGGTIVFVVKNIFFYFIALNIYLTIFNLIPVPPLDGSWILEEFLRGEALYYYQKIKPYGFLILILLIMVGVLDIIAWPILSFVANILRG